MRGRRMEKEEEDEEDKRSLSSETVQSSLFAWKQQQTVPRWR